MARHHRALKKMKGNKDLKAAKKALAAFKNMQPDKATKIRRADLKLAKLKARKEKLNAAILELSSLSSATDEQKLKNKRKSKKLARVNKKIARIE